MMSYWARIVGAWLLLTFASRLVKDAEKLFKATTSQPTTPVVTVVSEEWVDPVAKRYGAMEQERVEAEFGRTLRDEEARA